MSRPAHVFVLASLAMIASLEARAAGPAPLPSTTAERTRFKETGSYDEVRAMCAALADALPTRVRCVGFGTTPEGRPLLALVAGPADSLDAPAARAARRPVVLAQGGIHAGEIDGKDAGFIVLKELMVEVMKPSAKRRPLLDDVTFVFIPAISPDGHERTSPNNRPNQRGPAVMGFRTTAQNLNLNRDYMKVDAPEMRALLGLVNAWDPILSLDLHVTDGAQFQHDIAVMVTPRVVGPSALTAAGQALSQAFMSGLTAAKHLPVDFYPELEVHDDPRSGFAVGVPPPRFSNAYHALRNRLGVLVEAHSWKPYGARVAATADTLRIALAEARDHGAAWREAADQADAEARALGGQAVPLTWKNTAEKTTIAFKGYAYTRLPSAVSGGMMVRYDEKKPEVWQVPFLPGLEPDVSVVAPRAGYVIPAGFATSVIDRLRAHGIEFVTIDKTATLDVEVMRVDDATFGSKPFEGHQTMVTKAAWQKGRELVPAGSIFVPVGQPLGRVVVNLMEPWSGDSFAAWGFFNAQLEQKEYMEGYVAEEVAQQMLKDPAIRQAFEERLEKDPAFAASADARLDFFYRRHPSWDARAFRIPVFRVDVAP
ncbi:MAG: M14 family zinc carboxypeptidase [Myxococcota bacterium]